MLTHFAAAVEFLYDLHADLISLLSSIKRENTLIKEVLRQPWKNGKKTPSLRDEMEAWEENPEFGPSSSSSWDSIFFYLPASIQLLTQCDSKLTRMTSFGAGERKVAAQ